jgi:hypothetical protein
VSAPTTAALAVRSAREGALGHRLRLRAGYTLALGGLLALAAFGLDYYRLAATERPFSAKHALLKPSGILGVKLGLLGFALLLGIAAYPIRKRWAWLSRRGTSRHWLDVHVLLGLTAPLVIAFHSSFKFRGLAGMAFWIMAAVAASGIVGRYLYAQIPRRLTSAEVSFRELEELRERSAQELERQRVLPQDAVRRLLAVPSRERVEGLSLPAALLLMVALDLVRPLQIARLRWRALSPRERPLALGGLARTAHEELERAIDVARQGARLGKQMVFLERAQQVFRLWHVVHRPFSYSLAVLVLVHVAVAVMMGFY